MILPKPALHLLLATLLLTRLCGANVWLDDLDLGTAVQGWGKPRRNLSLDGNPLSVGGRKFERGFGTHSKSALRIHVGGEAQGFSAFTGVDDEVGPGAGSVEFFVYGDGRELWRSGLMHAGDAARPCSVSLAGVQVLELVVSDGGDGNPYDHADWVDAKIEAATANVFPTGDVAPVTRTDQPALRTVWLDQLNLANVTQGWGEARKNASVDGKKLSIAGHTYERGVGTHAESSLRIRLDGAAYDFSSFVGVDDEVKGHPASVRFIVLGDDKELWRSGLMRAGGPAQKCHIKLSGVKLLELRVDATDDGNSYDHANWADARFQSATASLFATVGMPVVAPYILTPPPPATPRINGAAVFGVRPRSPFLFTVPATGERPMRFAAENLPEGLVIDPITGRITGSLTQPGTHLVTLLAKNARGEARKAFRIVCGDRLALTPPMGWNSWNCFAQEVSAERVKLAADTMVSSGLVHHGWTYINIDDFWQNHRDSGDPRLRGDFRDTKGNILTNQRFPDMKGLVDYIHELGLKAGIYSSPGPWTCGGCAGSHGYEQEDARIYAEWGIDYLKYDWCSYGSIDGGQILDPKKVPSFNLGRGERDREAAIAPYRLMGTLLREQPRDIVYSLCQYGMSDVASWGDSVNGNCWRTTHDITDTWKSMRDIALAQDKSASAARPGNWNDPDMLILGHVGWGRPHPTRLTPDEQYLHMSLWCLFSAPLLIGCDMEKLDAFTLNLLTNDEVLAINQDALGRQATCVHVIGDLRIYMKTLEDGGRAVGFCNFGPGPVNLNYDAFAPLGLSGRQLVRDLWRQTDVATVDTANHSLPLTVPAHGVLLYKFTTAP